MSCWEVLSRGAWGSSGACGGSFCSQPSLNWPSCERSGRLGYSVQRVQPLVSGCLTSWECILQAARSHSRSPVYGQVSGLPVSQTHGKALLFSMPSVLRTLERARGKAIKCLSCRDNPRVFHPQLYASIWEGTRSWTLVPCRARL